VIGGDDLYYNPQANIPDDYYIDDHLATGRIELCINGGWSAVCQNVWTREDSSVACSQLGFASAGESVLYWCAILCHMY